MKRIITLLFLGLFCVFTIQVKAQNYSENLTVHFATLLENEELLADDVQWLITDENVSRTSNVNHVYFAQSLNDIKVFGTQSSIHILNGETISSNNRFVLNSADKVSGSSTPSINAVQAVTAAANQLNYTITEVFSVLEVGQGNNQKTILSKGGISLSNIPAKLVYHLTESNTLVLAWDISIQEISQQDWWSMRVDANTGNILNKLNWMVSCDAFDHDHTSDAHLDYNKNLYNIPNYKEVSEENSGCTECYEVFALPIESPYFGSRTIESGIEDATASPYGWHDTDGAPGAEFTVTEGNNVNAYELGDNPGYQPDGGPSLDFTGYPFDQVYTNVNQYEDASITQLFYWNNIIHDVMYQYGFDEESGNFQENNYGNGGLGSDSVNAEGQKGLVCNAFFGTPADGSNPTMQMFVCGNKDGDFDHAVVTHEHGHGIDRRLVAGPNNVNCNNNTENMGEGIGDWFGLMFTIQPGDSGTDGRGAGVYLLGQGPNGPGIRSYRYSTDMGINPQTYANLPSTGGQTHAVGEIWGGMIWEVSWALIDEHGFNPDIYNFTGDVNQDAGNIMALALIVEGLKTQPCNSGFVEARDAIFAADLAIYGGANECFLWEAFAKRGLGFSADQGSSNSHTDGTPAFDLPTSDLDTEDEVCVGQGVQVYGGGTPTGGEYSGPGVTDNGDGLTYDFDPAVAGIGIHTIEYDVVSACASGVASDDIEVTSGVPEIVCKDEITLALDENGKVTLESTSVVIEYTEENCGSPTTVTLSQELFTCDDIGTISIIVTVDDGNGNANICTAEVTVIDPLLACELSTESYELDKNIVLYPNPTSGHLTLINNGSVDLVTATVTDINGRTIKLFDLSGSNVETSMSIENLTSGMYFIKILSKETSIIRQIIKQ